MVVDTLLRKIDQFYRVEGLGVTSVTYVIRKSQNTFVQTGALSSHQFRYT